MGALFRNSDGSMLQWEAAGIFYQDSRFFMMECPDAFPLTNSTAPDAPFLFMASATVCTGTSVAPHYWVGVVDHSGKDPRFVVKSEGIWDYGAQGEGNPAFDARALPTYTSTKTGPADEKNGGRRLVFSWIRSDGNWGTEWWA